METSGLRVADFGVPTVNGMHFHIPSGKCFGLSGPSGAGKTLILRALADLDPHQGQMWLDGTAADAMAVHQWRRHVGLLPLSFLCRWKLWGVIYKKLLNLGLLLSFVLSISNERYTINTH